jgi:SAM-dependent methyltransferase
MSPQRGYHLKMVGIFLLIFATLVALFVGDYIRNSTRRWFSEDLPDPEYVRQWPESMRDEALYKLSRWDGFDPAQFRSFVEHQIRGLELNDPFEKFHFLEVGVGVGAFARHILHKYPNSTGMGIDLEPRAIAIAAEVLPHDRMALYVGDMLKIPAEAHSFHYVLVPGSLCYLHSLDDVLLAVAEFSRVLKPGGGLCASMLPGATSELMSCNVRVPKSIWTLGSRSGLRLVSMEEMSEWKLPHAFGRYSTCLRKT